MVKIEDLEKEILRKTVVRDRSEAIRKLKKARDQDSQDRDKNSILKRRIAMKDNSLPERYYLSIIKSLSRVFQAAVSYYHFDLSDFVIKFTQTHVFQNYDIDFTLYSQAPTYPIGKAIDELAEKNISFQKMSCNELEVIEYYEEAARWIGYVLMYWKVNENITEKDILKLNIDELIFGYEMLHTQSVSYALDAIKRDYMNCSMNNEVDYN